MVTGQLANWSTHGQTQVRWFCRFWLQWTYTVFLARDSIHAIAIAALCYRPSLRLSVTRVD